MSDPTVNTNHVYMIRHLERVDSGDDTTRVEQEEWKKIRDEYLTLVNPYLQKKNKLEQLVDNLEELRIDHIICSPYIRCIQTIMMASNEKFHEKYIVNIVDKTINVDYRLGELFLSELDFHKELLDLDTIFAGSRRYISEKLSTIPCVLDTSNNNPLTLTKYETDEEYETRINNCIMDLRKKYSGNLLIVTHRDAYTQYNDERKKMEYAKVYDITRFLESAVRSDTYELKYVKYKTKYLQLKNKLKK